VAGRATENDLARVTALAAYLVELHAEPLHDPIAYARAIRDLIGHGEGIFGIIDGYPDGVVAAPMTRLRAIEARCVAWRWRFRGRERRLRYTHGDFHPFNIVFSEGVRFRLLDASRGGCGDPADDVACMAINYLFFAIAEPRAAPAFRQLWHRFWRTILEGSKDFELLELVAPFLTWRALVLANPRWYPSLHADARDHLLGFAEAALEADRFDPEKWLR
jgi:aminoglycoside phosphotransferase (APT) family kinase protein